MMIDPDKKGCWTNEDVNSTLKTARPNLRRLALSAESRGSVLIIIYYGGGRCPAKKKLDLGGSHCSFYWRATLPENGLLPALLVHFSTAVVPSVGHDVCWTKFFIIFVTEYLARVLPVATSHDGKSIVLLRSPSIPRRANAAGRDEERRQRKGWKCRHRTAFLRQCFECFRSRQRSASLLHVPTHHHYVYVSLYSS